MDISSLKLKIVEDAYLAAAGEIDWQAFMQNFTQFSAVKTTMSSHDILFTNVDALIQVNYDPDYIQAYQQHYFQFNPWAKLLEELRYRPEGAWGHSAVPVASLSNTEFYQDWILPQGNIADGYAINLAHSPKHSVSLTCNVSPEHMDEALQIEDILLSVGGRVRRAIELQRKLEGQKLRANNYEQVLNQLQNAVIITDERQHLVFANNKAEAILSSGQLFCFDTGSRLRFINSENQKRLQESLTTSNGVANGHMPFSILLEGNSAYKYYLFVAPLIVTPSEQNDITRLWKAPRQFAWFIVTPDQTISPKQDIVQTLLGVTATEARLALSLFENKTLAEYADQHGVSIKTVRTQSKSLLSKTQCRKQSELVSKLNRLFAHFNME